MRVAVIGAGVGGLTAALALRAKGLEATVYERATGPRPVGASLSLGPNAVRLLKALGLLEPLRRVAVVPQAVDWVRWDDGRVLMTIPLGEDMERVFGAPQLDCYRPDVMDVLAHALPKDALCYGAEVLGVEQDDEGVTLVFAGGATARAEAVIAADGIRSTVRARIFGDGAPVFSGMTAYRAVLDRHRALDLHPEGLDRYWIGPDRHGVAYWLSAGRRLAVTLAVRGAEPSEESWTAEAPPEEVLATVNGWDAGLRRRIGRCARFIKTAVYVRAPLESWSHGRLALLGDAAHAMEPALGQGASQAVEDAYVLAECLRDDPSDAAAALRRYETARRTRATDQQAAAAAAMTSFFLPDGHAQRTRDAQWRELPKTYRFGPRQPIWTYDARDALEQGLSPG